MEAVDALVSSGCHPSKVVLGLPAYGRHKIDPSQVKTYSELINAYMEQSSTISDGNDYEGGLHRNLQQMTEYNSYTMESRNLILEKVDKLIFDRHLSGVFLWEMGQDYRGDAFREGLLLHHVREAFAVHGRRRGSEDGDEL